MITIRKGHAGLNIISLGKRIGKANASIPRQFQWLVYRVVLIISDIVMLDPALRLAYHYRFEAALDFFWTSAPWYQLNTIDGWLFFHRYSGYSYLRSMACIRSA